MGTYTKGDVHYQGTLPASLLSHIGRKGSSMGADMETRNMAQDIHLSLALKQATHPHLGQFEKKGDS